jgi:hypothetical protein
MRIPTLCGIIDRRILINYRVDPALAARVLPAPFRPKLVRGCSIGGVCLIRLKDIRPRGLPSVFGVTSENAAHRFAVEWREGELLREGVYIPRRDTASRVNQWAGGRLFPGVHHRARFDVSEADERFSVAMESEDGEVRVGVVARLAAAAPEKSVFRSTEEARRFFEAGSMGLSATRRVGEFDALELRCPKFEVRPLEVESVWSSFFEDACAFPAGSIELDSAFLMQRAPHEWYGRERPVRAGELNAVTL